MELRISMVETMQHCLEKIKELSSVMQTLGCEIYSVSEVCVHSGTVGTVKLDVTIRLPSGQSA
jgi:hypothetical protein